MVLSVACLSMLLLQLENPESASSKNSSNIKEAKQEQAMKYSTADFEYQNGQASLADFDRQPNNLFHRDAYERKIEQTQPYTLRNSTNSGGRVFELTRLENNTGRHATPDAVVYIPNGFDARKPVKLVVYNHGLETNAQSAFKDSLAKQMTAVDSNTIVIVPEWQSQPNTRSSPNDARFHDQGFFKNMLSEILHKTPPLRNLTIDKISEIGLITHSGGFKATMSQMYGNGLYEKVTSLTILDSMYNPKGFDRWMQDNIEDLSTGRKQLQVIYTNHLEDASLDFAKRIQNTLRQHRLPPAVHFERGDSKTVVESDTFAHKGIIFKKSDFRFKNDSAHGSMTHVYVREVLNAQKIAGRVRQIH